MSQMTTIRPVAAPAFTRAAEWVMAACVLAAAALTLWHAAGEARLPYQLDYEEGNILNAGVRLNAGLSAYPDPSTFPNALDPYGPIGYFLVEQAVRVGGVSLTLPRALVIFCGLAAAILLFNLIRMWTGSALLATAFGMYFLANGVTRAWIPLLRVDLIAIVLSLAGLWLCMRSEGRWWLAAALLFWIALFVKLTALAAPAACFLWLASRRDVRRALLMAATLVALTLAGFAAMQSATGGHFLFHMLRTHPDPYTYRRLLGIFVLVEPSVVALAPLLIAFLFLRARRALPALLYLLCALGVVMVTGGKAGSFINHFLEPIAACSIAAALGYQALAEMPRAPRLLPLLPLTVGVAALYLTGAFTQDTRIVPLAISGCGELYQTVRESPARRVLAENTGLVVLSGKEVWDSNPFVLTQLVRSKALSGAQLERMVANREFEMIVLNSEPEEMKVNGSRRWWGRIVSAMADNYRVVHYYDCQEANVLVVPK